MVPPVGFLVNILPPERNPESEKRKEKGRQGLSVFWFILILIGLQLLLLECSHFLE